MAEMKNSGIDWIGDIPQEWELKPIFSCLEEINIKNSPIQTTNILSLTNKDGVIPYSEKGNQGNKAKENFEEYKVVLPNTIVANSMNILIGSVGLSQYEGCVSPVYYIYSAKDNNDIRFFNYVFQTVDFQKQLRKFANGILEIRLRVSSHDILHQKLALPSINEQQAIADYLDDQCSKIDEIIAEAKASIEDYQELKKSILFKVTTEGLRKSEMKETEFDWLHLIPINWKISKITRVLDYNNAYPIGDGDHGLITTESYIKEGVPYIRVQNLGWGTDLKLSNVVYISEEDNQRIISSQLKPGDILFAKTGATIGKTAIVPNNMPIANTTSHVGKITVSLKHNPKYYFYLLSSFFGYKQFWDIACMKATRPELSINEIKQMKILIPETREEEDEIAEYLDNIIPEYDALILEKQSLISDLEAYKKSLIYETVTGKRRVV